MSKEVELKLVVLSGGVESRVENLLKVLQVESFDERWLINTYFDSQELELNKQRVALRIRESSGRFIQTLKTKGSSAAGVHSRGEWEWELPSSQLDGALLEMDEWPKAVSVDDLRPVFETNFKRLSAVIDYGGSKIELAIDEGFISAGGAKSSLCEVELEIIEGEVSDLFGLAKLVASTMPVMLSNVSKAERGYRLASGVVGASFDRAFECDGSYKGCFEMLVEKSLSEWLYLFDQVSQSRSPAALAEMYGVLSVLSELLLSVDMAEPGSIFEKSGLLVSQRAFYRRVFERVVDGGLSLEGGYDAIVANAGSGQLAVAVGEWLYQRG